MYVCVMVGMVGGWVGRWVVVHLSFKSSHNIITAFRQCNNYGACTCSASTKELNIEFTEVAEIIMGNNIYGLTLSNE